MQDKPTIEYPNGNKFWLKHGEYHRENGPAIECADGTKRWYLNGVYQDRPLDKTNGQV